MAQVIRDLSHSAEDIDRLTRFYADLYVSGFPDPDERESCVNMKRYLQLRSEGWYGDNNYHIMLMLDGGRAIAASISDYLSTPNCGIIEFILVDEAARGRGVGKVMHDATMAALEADARRARHARLDGIVIELNDPYQVPASEDNYDPFERALIWSRWGYGRLCFPYEQPALSEEQQPVTCLLLAIKPLSEALATHVPSPLVTEILEGYLKWAMRIDEPNADPTFARMQEFLAKHATIPVEPLAVYVGRDPDRPLLVTSVTRPDDPAFAPATALYARVFQSGPTVIDKEMFRDALAWTAGRTDLHYHLWALSTGPREPITGMASFFVMPRFGFGGYMAFEPPLRGTGRAGVALRRLEERMIRDEPGARRLYIECVPGSPEEGLFLAHGFSVAPVEYYQPPVAGAEVFGDGRGPRVTLLSKQLGEDYGRTPFIHAEFCDDLKVWLREVYRLSRPEESETFRIACASARGGSAPA